VTFVTQNAAGALYTVNKLPGYNIGGNSELATSGPDNSSEKEVFSVLVEYSYSMKFYDQMQLMIVNHVRQWNRVRVKL